MHGETIDLVVIVLSSVYEDLQKAMCTEVYKESVVKENVFPRTLIKDIQVVNEKFLLGKVLLNRGNDI